MSRRYSRRHYSKRNQMDELGCIVNLFVLPIGIATALLFSKDSGKKKIGWCMVVCMAAFCFMISIGASGETSIVVVGIIIGIMIVLSSVNSSKNPNLQESVARETTSQNTNVSLESNRKDNLDNAEKKVNYQKSIQENSTDEKELSKNKSVIQGNYPSDTIFDENLVLLETNGKRVYQKISNKKEATVFTEFEHTEKNIKNDDSMISAALPRVYYSSVLDAAHKNHVPESYCKIMIEQIRNTNVKECPGIAWKDSERFYILPLIVGYPIYSWPTDQVFDIERLKIENVNSEQTYLDLIDQPIADEYEGLMPEYFMGDLGVDTERYVLSNGVEVTYASGKVLKEMLCLKK